MHQGGKDQAYKCGDRDAGLPRLNTTISPLVKEPLAYVHTEMFMESCVLGNKNTLSLKEDNLGTWRDGLEVKSSYFSCRGHKFSLQCSCHPHQVPMTKLHGNPNLCLHEQCPHMSMSIPIPMHMHITKGDEGSRKRPENLGM